MWFQWETHRLIGWWCPGRWWSQVDRLCTFDLLLRWIKEPRLFSRTLVIWLIRIMIALLGTERSRISTVTLIKGVNVTLTTQLQVFLNTNVIVYFLLIKSHIDPTRLPIEFVIVVLLKPIHHAQYCFLSNSFLFNSFRKDGRKSYSWADFYTITLRMAVWIL